MSSKIIELKHKNLKMERNGYFYHLELFRKDKMIVETKVFKDEKFIKNETIPFAQLTKTLKKVLN